MYLRKAKAIADFFERQNIKRQLVSAEELQKIMQAEALEKNEVSQGIIQERDH